MPIPCYAYVCINNTTPDWLKSKAKQIFSGMFEKYDEPKTV